MPSGRRCEHNRTNTRTDGYRISEVAAPPVSSEPTWHRVRDPAGRHVGTFSVRKAATDAIAKDKRRRQ